MSFLTLFALLIELLEVFCPRIEFYMMVGSGVYVDYFFLYLSINNRQVIIFQTPNLFLMLSTRFMLAMKAIVLATFCSFGCVQSVDAQIEIEYPYNPDSDGDEVIGSSDLLSLLRVFGLQYELDSIYIDGIGLEAFLLELTEVVLELQNN